MTITRAIELTDLGASIDKQACIQWVGEVYLEAKATGTTSAIDESEFTNAWKDQLPESWREDVSKSILPVSGKLSLLLLVQRFVFSLTLS